MNTSELHIYSLQTAPWFLVAHLAAALCAVVLGAAVLFCPKGTEPHKMMGRVWVGLMLFVAISSFWIQARGHLSWIHGLSVFIILNMVLGVYGAKTKNIKLHRGCMVGSYFGLLGAGAFTLLPHRMLGILLFG